MTDKQFLEREISEWMASPERKMQFDAVRYYNGDHDILWRKRMVIVEGGKLEENENLVNNKIVDNQFGRAVDKKLNYFCGLPFTFDTENKAVGNPKDKKIFLSDIAAYAIENIDKEIQIPQSENTLRDLMLFSL